ncbi:stage II sporulation protein M [Clostridium pasteurianum]|uniref:stage II sporulation protein M n=1 Tax=Clostridium pasteurianum TaxID=1501 RepID=UPI002260BEA4|nr:stage II sporulation protein M [Clostridium pasteurianum]UZW14750.1 stage II sporulation protein M [Clostridium pasteurianum]
MFWFLEKGNRKYFIISLLTFILIFILSYYISSDMLKVDIKVNNDDLNNKQFLVTSMWNFFLNNIKVFVIASIGFSVFTFTTLVSQSYSMGAMLALWINQGYSIGKFCILLLPHGIFELISLIISSAIGFKITVLIIHNLKYKKLDYKLEIIKIIKSFFLVIILTLIAAFIEFFITPKLM